MKYRLPASYISMLILVLLAPVLQAKTVYVDLNGSHDTGNSFNSWAGAATNIHDAIAIAASGDTITVSNGQYTVTNLIEITDFTLQSVNGPGSTTLYRPVYSTNRILSLTNSAAFVSGFSITNAFTNNYGTPNALAIYNGTASNCVVKENFMWTGQQTGIIGVYGNGVFKNGVISNNQSRSWVCNVSGNGIIQDSVIARNYTPFDPAPLAVGGNGIIRRCHIMANIGDYGSDLRAPVAVGASGWVGTGGTLENCLIWGNSSANGAAVGMGTGSKMINCTVASNKCNSAYYAVTLSGSSFAITNCIIYGNNAFGQSGSTTVPMYSCAPELTTGVNGNKSTDPKFANMAAGDLNLNYDSPCVNSGTNIPSITVDVAGTARDSFCDMGALERIPSAGSLLASFTGTPLTGIGSVTSLFTVALEGGNTNITTVSWDYDNDGNYDQVGGNELLQVSREFLSGRYGVSVLVSNDGAQSSAYTNLAYVAVQSAGNDVYVSTGGSATFPFDTWAKAASDLEDAFLNATHAGSTVWVSNGTYAVTAQLTLNTNKAVKGVGGPAGIVLYKNSANYFPIFSLSHTSAMVSSVIISNAAGNGSGACFSMSAGTVSNCIMTKTTTGVYPDTVFGMSGGLVTHCVLTNNSPRSHSIQMTGGTIQDTLITASVAGHDVGVLYVGGAGAVVRRCKLLANTPPGNIAGALRLDAGRVENCLVWGNRAASSQYGAVRMSGGALINCTIASNSTANTCSGVTRSGGGITNCIIYGNNSAYPEYNGSIAAVWNSCATQLTDGVQGNINSDPLFTSLSTRDCTLTKNSRCIDSAATLFWTLSDTDLAGESRIRGDAVDMGCFEAEPLPGTKFIFM